MKKNHELRQLEVCDHRGIFIDNEAPTRLKNLTRGFEGEHTVYQWFQSYSKQSVHIIDDYWFYHGKNMQIDMLVIVDNRWIVVEVKNYHRYFEYSNNECYLNGKLMSDNHFIQLAHRTQRMRHIASELNPNIQVESVMVFIDEHCEINIQSKVSTKVIQRNQLKNYIETLSSEQKRRGDRVTSISLISKHLEYYRVPSPFKPKVIDDPTLQMSTRPGIHCAHCHSYQTLVSDRYIKCKACGHNEAKNLAICRVALELRYIHYYHPEKVTTHAIYELCGRTISKKTISQVLKTQYSKVDKGPRTYYEIPLE